jgi:hypothetical protein
MSRNFIPALFAIGVGVFSGKLSRGNGPCQVPVSNLEFFDIQAITPSTRHSNNSNTRKAKQASLHRRLNPPLPRRAPNLLLRQAQSKVPSRQLNDDDVALAAAI